MDPRTPILIGVGTSCADAEAVELMGRAAEAAGVDCGVPGLLAEVERIAVTRGTWSYTDPARVIGRRVGAGTATTVLVDVGIPQQTVIDETLQALVDGDIDIALVVGGEAKARAGRIQRASTPGDAAGMAAVFGGGTAEARATETDHGDVAPDVRQSLVGDLVDPAELHAGLWAPVDQYALIEMALGAAEARTVDALRDEVAAVSAAQNEVARSNPDAAFPAPMTASQIREFGPGNRPLAFPYAKWHVTQWTVDQAAALLFTTVGKAEAAGVPRDRWVFPLVGLGSSHMVPLTQRADLHRWPAMAVLGEAAAARLGHPLHACEHVELYSCFPVAVRVQQRELGLDPDLPTTVTGGMVFAGGPFNSAVFQSLAALVRRLRVAGGRGLITSVSGLLTKPGLSVWATESDGRLPLLADLAQAAAAATETVPVRLDAEGAARVVSCTVTHDGLEPAEVVAIVETSDGVRSVVRSAEPSLMAAVMAGDSVGGLIGTTVVVADGRVVPTPTAP